MAEFPKIAVLVGTYFPSPDWTYYIQRIPTNVWLEHFKKQTPNSDKCRFIISDSGSHQSVKDQLAQMASDNVEVYLDGPKGEMLNFNYMVSKLKDEEYILYSGNDMLIRNHNNEDWLSKGVEILNKYDCLAYSIYDGLNHGNGSWEYKRQVDENLYEIDPFSTRFMLMKRSTIDLIDWEWLKRRVNETEPGWWEGLINEYFSTVNRITEINHLAYKHSKLGTVSISNYTPEKVDRYVNTTDFIPQNY